ncbi:MAG: hypothetical protein GX878_00310 [Firmicutes bacterium]|nr:hypothetical protein [Bacillota bacterium]
MKVNMAVLGAPRSGKTLFCINFAQYLGSRILNYTEESVAGRRRGTLSPAAAREMMVFNGQRGRGVVRTFAVHLLRQPCKRIALIDTASLKEGVPLPYLERSRLLLTLQALESAVMVLQMIDLSCNDPARLEFDEKVGRFLAAYCRRRDKLFLTAGSKADLIGDSSGRERITASGRILYISSLTQAGFPRLHSDILDRAVLSSSQNH